MTVVLSQVLGHVTQGTTMAGDQDRPDLPSRRNTHFPGSVLGSISVSDAGTYQSQTQEKKTILPVSQGTLYAFMGQMVNVLTIPNGATLPVVLC